MECSAFALKFDYVVELLLYRSAEVFISRYEEREIDSLRYVNIICVFVVVSPFCGIGFCFITAYLVCCVGVVCVPLSDLR